MNTMETHGIAVKKPMGPEYYVSHYLNLVWRWKWYIFTVTPVVFLCCAVAALKFGYNRPFLESTVTLQFVQPTNAMGAMDYSGINLQRESIEAFIRSRPFLQTIAEKLSFQVMVKKYFRSDIFDSIFVDQNAPIGSYDFKVKKDEYTLFFSNKQRFIKKRIIATGKLFELASFPIPSVVLRLSRDFVAEPHSFSFDIVRMQDAVQQLGYFIAIRFFGERQTNIMTISFRGADYPLIAEVANSLADAYIFRNTALKRNNQTGAVETLERQLQSAKADLAVAEGTLSQFREQNPSVGATSMLATSVAEVSSIDNSISAIQRSVNDALALQLRCSNGPSVDDRLTALFEAVSFLSVRQSVAAAALQLELNEVINEKHSVDANYSPQHPLVIENQKKIDRLAANIVKALSNVADKMRMDISAATLRKNTLSEEFKKLPSKELRYADLERRRASASDLYSKLLARYNADKISEAAQGSDLVIMDRGVIPTAPGRLQSVMQLLMMGALVALCCGLGPPVGLDFIDKRARSEGDCKRFVSLPFLEVIPTKESTKEKKKKGHQPEIDDRLVAAGFEPTPFDEMYRSLRTKILLHLHGEAHKLLVVTSLNMGEGKSLTASNISIVMAQQKIKTLLIDGDLRRGVQHHSFLVEKKPGLSEILSSPDELTTIPINSMIQKTHIPNLFLLSCGLPISNPAECMNSQKFRELSTMLSEWFEMVVLDTPPLRVAVDAAILPEAFKHYVVVARAAKTNLTALENKINDFPGLRQKVLGIVLNGAPIDKNKYSYSYSYYRH